MRIEPDSVSRPDIHRASFAGSIETAGEVDGQFRLAGVANTFRVMRSGRLFARKAFDRWLAATKRIDLPLLANHGGHGSVDFATIGRVDRLRADPKRGLLFEGWVAGGTKPADEARALIAQKALKSISVGWIARHARYIRKSDADLDADIEQQLDEAGVEEAHVFLDVEAVEISPVDVPDDPGAQLAARADSAAIDAALSPLREELQALRSQVQSVTRAGSPEVAALTAALRDEFHCWLASWKDAAIETLQSDSDVIDEARLFREGLAGLGGEDLGGGDDAGDDDLAALQRRVAAGPSGRRDDDR